MKKRDFYKKIKQYPELFDEVEQNEQEEDAGFQIDEKDIPPIPQWFYDYEEQERHREKRKRMARTVVAVPVCAALVLVFLITPFGSALADNVYHFFTSLYEDSGTFLTSHNSETSYNFIQEKIPEEQQFQSTEAIRSQYDIVFAENKVFQPDQITVSKIENLGYQVELSYIVDSNVVTIINVYHFVLTQQTGSTMATGENFEQIDTSLQDGTQITGIYDDEGAIASGFNDKLDVTFMTDTLPYDQLIDFIQTTTIK